MKYSHRTADQWQLLVSQQQSSELTAPKFCEQHNIGYASFCQWRKRLAEPAAKLVESPAFIELSTPGNAQSQHWAVELEIASGMVLRIAKA